MRDSLRADIAARVCLTLAALLPYWRLLTFGVIYVTDDYFASDIYNAELPVRALMGQLIRDGQLPIWTSQLCSGLPLAGAPSEPIGLAAFSLLPPAAALDALVIVLLLVAAHGTYGLARRFGTDRPAAVLAGIAFAGSGYIACQLKHLSIVSTVVWLPVGLLLIDRALAVEREPVSPKPAGEGGPKPRSRRGRALFMALFGLVFAQQALAGFPQSAYICALVYGSFAVFRTLADRKGPGTLRGRLLSLGGLSAAALLGASAAAVVLLPLAHLGRVSDRAEALGYEWSTRLAYWPPNVLTFLLPYVNGDISNNTYMGPPFFWEDYGYVGIATFLLAFYGAVRERRRPIVAFLFVMTLVAYLFVLGQATPVFKVAYLLIPGMKLFRFPTRFLIVVELGLALLAAFGLSRLREDLGRVWRAPSQVPRLIVLAVCAGTALDLFVHQPRQNPMVPAREWLAPPRAVEIVRSDTPQPRTFTPRHRDLHRQAFLRARGWTDVKPYFDLRATLPPNLGGGLWGTPSADCYSGITARWYIDVWGDHNREASLMSSLANVDFDAGVLRAHPALANVLRTYGVTHLLSPVPQRGTSLALLRQDPEAYIYRVEGAARVRVVRAARQVGSDREAAERLLDSRFDPDLEVLLYDAPEAGYPTADGVASPPAAGRATVTRESSREVLIEADAPANSFLLLADTYYPGWTAHVDGAPAPIYRANHSVRAIHLPQGRHEVRFTYEPPGFVRGLQVTVLGLSALFVWVGAAVWVDRRARRTPAAVVL